MTEQKVYQKQLFKIILLREYLARVQIFYKILHWSISYLN